MKICIDAGHNYSGYDTGAIGNGIREQDISFYISDLVRKKLTANGITVVMTRNKITDNVGKDLKSSINGRCDIANKNKCDLFVSIHCNAGGGQGTETLCFSKGCKAEKSAKKVQTSIVNTLATVNRGVKYRTDLGVLKYTNMPAILIETAFIDNASDADKLKNRQVDYANAICGAIYDYCGIKSTAEPISSANDIVNALSNQIVINDKNGAISALEKAKAEENPLYWILYKIINK